MEKWQRLLVMVSTFLAIFVLTACVVRLLGYISHTVILFALGALLAYALDPLVERLRLIRIGRNGKQPSREASVTAVVVGVFVAIGGAGWILSGFLVKQIGSLQRNIPKYHTFLLTKANQADVWLAARHLHTGCVDAIRHPPADVVAAATKAGHDMLPAVGHFLSTTAESIVVLLIAVYFLAYCGGMKEQFNGMLPPDLRQRAEAWQADVNRILGSFVRGQLLIAVLVGGCAAIGCLLVGIHLWLIIGLVVVCAALIPVFGPYLGVIPALLAALIGHTHFGPLVSSIIIVVWFTLVNEIGSKILYPKLVGEALGLHPVLVLFVLFAGLEIAGVIGVLFAAPLTAMTMVTIIHLYRLWQELPDSPINPAPPPKPQPASHPERLVRRSKRE